MSWFWNGLRHGVPTTRYPARPETAPGVAAGFPIATHFGGDAEAARAAAVCPTGALVAHGSQVAVEIGRCIWCQRCHFASPDPGSPDPMNWQDGFAPATLNPAGAGPLPAAFAASLHVIVVDAGDCGACLNEVKQLNNPFYNFHRLGLFFTATPRAADVLLVVGPVSENMRGPLLKTFEAMPGPKRIMAVGTCALSGGVFGQSFMCAGGVAAVLQVDLEVPGDPPPPLAILHGLLRLAGRAPAAATPGGAQ